MNRQNIFLILIPGKDYLHQYTSWCANIHLGVNFALISKFQPKGEILDIGCATGQFLNYMAEHGWKTTGIEPDEKTRARAISEYGLQVFPEEHLILFENLLLM